MCMRGLGKGTIHLAAGYVCVTQLPPHAFQLPRPLLPEAQPSGPSYDCSAATESPWHERIEAVCTDVSDERRGREGDPRGRGARTSSQVMVSGRNFSRHSRLARSILAACAHRYAEHTASAPLPQPAASDTAARTRLDSPVEEGAASAGATLVTSQLRALKYRHRHASVNHLHPSRRARFRGDAVRALPARRIAIESVIA